MFLENTQIQNFMKICPLEADLFNADVHIQKQMEGRTDITKLNFAFRDLAHASKSSSVLAILSVFTNKDYL